MENCTMKNCGADLNASLTNDSVTTDIPVVESLKLGLEVLIALFGVLGNVLVAVVICRMGKKKKTSRFLPAKLSHCRPWPSAIYIPAWSNQREVALELATWRV